MHFPSLITQLEDALGRPLPGTAAQARMAPQPMRQWPAGFNPARVRHAAGLVLLFPEAGEARLVLTVRSDRVRHAGQVSFPGGVVEPGESFEQAALREAHEEVAVPPGHVRMLGALTPIDIHVSGFRLFPIVAAADTRPPLTPSDEEVARILEVDLDRLMAPQAVEWRALTRERVTYDVPAFLPHGPGSAEIWGATAMVLAELLTMLGWAGPATPPLARS